MALGIAGVFPLSHAGRILVVVSPLVQEPAGKAEITLLTGAAVQLDQRQLDFLMARRGEGRSLFLHENTGNAVRIPAHGPEKPVPAGGVLICYGGLDQMARTVKFMGKPLPKPVFRFHDSKIDIEIAVLLLMGHDEPDQLLHPFLQPGIRMHLQDIGGGFLPFGHVGIVKNVGFVGHPLFPVKAEGGETASFFKAFPDVADGYVAVEFLPIMPKSVIQLHGREGEVPVRFHRDISPFQRFAISRVFW